MVRSTPIQGSHENFCSIPLAIGIFVSVSAIVALCAKNAKRVSRKQSTIMTGNNNISITSDDQQKFSLRSPLRSPKQLIITTISSINPFVIKQKRSGRGESEAAEMVEEGFGEGGLWQKGILMGEKCQPPEFSGVIYYDCDGNRISEFSPRSPRAGSEPNFSFPVVKTAI